jgi:Flp pilus assembly protein TadD
MVERPKPYDPFIARMDAKRQAEWEARLARETADKKITVWKKLVGWVTFLWKELPAFVLSFSSLLGLAGLLYLCWLLVNAVLEPTIVFAPIPIPKELADRGYTPEVVAERMHSALASLGKDVKYSTVVNIGRKKKSGAANPIETVAIIGDSLVAEQVKLPNIVIPNIGLPIETLATSIRHFFHLESHRNVSGEITSPQKKLLLRLQIDEQDLGPDPVPGILEAPDDMFVQAAKEVLVKVIELDLKDASSYNNLGVALRDLGKTDEAIAEFKKAAELDPKYALPHNNLGVLLRGQGKTDEAIAEFKKAADIDAKYASPHNGLGNALSDQGKIDEAIAEYSKAIELDPGNASPHSNLGVALASQGKTDEAIAEYRKAIELDPKDAWPHSNLGFVLGLQGKTDEAIAEFKKAIESIRKMHCPTTIWAWLWAVKARPTKRSPNSKKPLISMQNMRRPTPIWALLWTIKARPTKQSPNIGRPSN